MIFLILFLLLFSAISPDNECPYRYKFYANTAICYHLSDDFYDFNGAVRYCESTGGKLVSLIQGERAGIANLTSHLLVQPWVASKRNTTTGIFYNLDHSVFISDQWAQGEPNPANGDCVTFKGVSSNFGLQTTQCYQQQYAFCKIVPDLCNGGIQHLDQFNRHSTQINTITMGFRTNYVFTDIGFHATWNVERIQPPIISNTTNYGELTSPNYPEDYDTFDKQLFYIQVVEGGRINVTIDDFFTQETFDYLDIFDSSNQSSKVVRLSGNSVAPWSWLSTSSVVLLKFVSDGSYQYRGWHLTWNMI
ncbi:hypothetical protein L3Y34_009123 [Caenorhabditis briggsae]|uniref:C-type LECtin n=1 Tax=Caenorhabditis briggsae TaxID=6238 RepID=A0AAE9A4L4_CAEBR|nr:hypothetical protein L3Y34_009123 [Caenorhabditis briggsae]